MDSKISFTKFFKCHICTLHEHHNTNKYIFLESFIKLMVPFLRKPDTSAVSSCSCYVDKDISVYFLTVPSCSF